MKQALLYQKLDDQKVRCNICHHRCLILPGKRGICGVRENQNGILYAINYGLTTGLEIDPIEKKPFKLFLSGTRTMSFNTVGCNFRCLHCLNYWTSQADYFYRNINQLQEISPQQIVDVSLQYNCPSISYTYTEPTVFLEYALETMQIAKKNNLKNIWVTNGYMSDETLELISPYLDAINVDLKSFTEKFYQEICGAHLQPVLNNLIKIKQSDVHLEITTLIIPTKNDSENELRQLTKFIYQKLGPDTPWHVSGFYPTYKMLDLPPAPPESIRLAGQIGKETGLKNIYTYVH